MAAKQRGARGKQRGKRRASPRQPRAASGLVFNHAMVYVTDVARSLAFYRDALGFRMVEEYPGGYARLRAPVGDATIALHAMEAGQQLLPAVGGMRLYFEVRALDRFCAALAARGVVFMQPPKAMPWGWRHAYLQDPDGHEISLYRAGTRRLRPTRWSGGDDA